MGSVVSIIVLNYIRSKDLPRWRRTLGVRLRGRSQFRCLTSRGPQSLTDIPLMDEETQPK